MPRKSRSKRVSSSKKKETNSTPTTTTSNITSTSTTTNWKTRNLNSDEIPLSESQTSTNNSNLGINNSSVQMGTSSILSSDSNLSEMAGVVTTIAEDDDSDANPKGLALRTSTVPTSSKKFSRTGWSRREQRNETMASLLQSNKLFYSCLAKALPSSIKIQIFLKMYSIEYKTPDRFGNSPASKGVAEFLQDFCHGRQDYNSVMQGLILWFQGFLPHQWSLFRNPENDEWKELREGAQELPVLDESERKEEKKKSRHRACASYIMSKYLEKYIASEVPNGKTTMSSEDEDEE